MTKTKQQLSHTAQKVANARSKMVTNQFFWGELSLPLRLRESKRYPSINTDGTHLDFNPEWVEKINDLELQGVIAFKTAQCALRHPYRIPPNCSKQNVNIASEKIAASIIADAGFTLPAGVQKLEQDEKDLSFEQLCAKLEADAMQERMQQQQKQKQEQQNGSGSDEDSEGSGSSDNSENEDDDSDSDSEDENDSDSDSDSSEDDDESDDESEDDSDSDNGEGSDDAGESDSNESGEDPAEESYDSPVGSLSPAAEAELDEDEKPLIESDWSIAVEMAQMTANMAGKMPGAAERLLESDKIGSTSLREQLRQFMEHVTPSGQSWTRPNRRFVSSNTYLPGTVRENMPRFAIIVDTSGSVWYSPGLPEKFAQITSDLMHELKPTAIDVFYVDTALQHTETFTPDDTELVLRNLGGGGTAFQPGFDAVEASEETYAAMIYLTDMDNFDDGALVEPSIPLLWVCPDFATKTQPFGTVAKLSELER